MSIQAFSYGNSNCEVVSDAYVWILSLFGRSIVSPTYDDVESSSVDKVNHGRKLNKK